MSYKQKSPKNIPIDLSPRLQKIEAACDAKDLIYVKKGDDYHEMEFFDAVKNKPNSLHKFVVSQYRLKLPSANLCIDKKSTEVIVYYLQQTAERFNGSQIQDDRMQGVYFVPQTKNNVNLSGKTQKIQVTNEIPVFELPFSPEEVEKIINESEIEVTQFYVSNASNKGPEITTGTVYAIQNKEDFKEGTFQELWDMGVYNYSTTEPRLAQWRQEGKDVKKQARQLQTVGNAGRQ